MKNQPKKPLLISLTWINIILCSGWWFTCLEGSARSSVKYGLCCWTFFTMFRSSSMCVSCTKSTLASDCQTGHGSFKSDTFLTQDQLQLFIKFRSDLIVLSYYIIKKKIHQCTLGKICFGRLYDVTWHDMIWWHDNLKAQATHLTYYYCLTFTSTSGWKDSVKFFSFYIVNFVVYGGKEILKVYQNFFWMFFFKFTKHSEIIRN